MGFAEDQAEFLPHDPEVGDILRSLDEESCFDMANLGEQQTGVPGVISISTVYPAHGPRVKYSLKAGRGPSFSVSIEAEPRVVATSMPPHEMRAAAPAVIEWVRKNREALLRFWSDGEGMMSDEVRALQDSLQKV